MILTLLKVLGDSLWPLYEDGDYVLAVHPRLARPIKPGDVVVFRHPVYGIMIKKVERLAPDGQALYVVGTHERSVDSRDFGAVSRQSVLGKVIWRIHR